LDSSLPAGGEERQLYSKINVSYEMIKDTFDSVSLRGLRRRRGRSNLKYKSGLLRPDVHRGLAMTGTNFVTQVKITLICSPEM